MNKIIPLTGEVLETFQSVLCQFFRLCVIAFCFNNLGPDASSSASIRRSHYSGRCGNRDIQEPHDRFLHEKVDWPRIAQVSPIA
jgi:hypothetical protein